MRRKLNRTITVTPILLSLQVGVVLISCGGSPLSKDDARRSVVADTLVEIGRRDLIIPVPTTQAHRSPGTVVAAPVGRNSNRRASLFNAICKVESNNDPTKYNRKEKAAGIAQIRPICLQDINRILGIDRYTLTDRYNPTKVHAMFFIYTGHYAKGGTLEEMARIWNGDQGERRKNQP